MSGSRYGLHAFVDDLTAAVARLATGRNRFFTRGLESAPLPDVIRVTTVDAPPLDGAGIFEAPGEVPAGTPRAAEGAAPGIFEATATTPAGTLDPAFRVARWRSPDHPTLLYLQGSGERPFDDSARARNSFRSVVLDAEPGWDANLLVLRAPFHAGSQREYARAMGELGNFTSMLAAMVVLTEKLVRALAAARDGNGAGARTVVTGISLGGWATNLHAACFGSADAYVPVMAGAALDDLFLRSSYRWLAGGEARAKPDRIGSVLNFEAAFRDASADRVFPLLGRHDRFIRYGPQARSYGGIEVAAMERGHVTAVAAPAPIRAHLRRFVPAG